MQSSEREDPITHAGEPLASATVAVILLHGRGSRADAILGLAGHLPSEGAAFLAPEAPQGSWYPDRFLAPRELNEPWLGAALQRVTRCVAQAEAAGLRPEQIVLCGFSQGACLALEFASRNPRRYGAVAGLSGALIGPLDELEGERSGDLLQTPVLLGCAAEDAHIPIEHVEASERVLVRQNANVEKMVFPGQAHTVFQEELDWLRRNWPDVEQ